MINRLAYLTVSVGQRCDEDPRRVAHLVDDGICVYSRLALGLHFSEGLLNLPVNLVEHFHLPL